jgi:hypothetical protein
VGREAGPEYDAGERWAIMSKRFLRWAETWIEDNIPPGANPDIESHAARAKRLTEQLFAEGAAAKFSDFEIGEEREGIKGVSIAFKNNSMLTPLNWWNH